MVLVGITLVNDSQFTNTFPCPIIALYGIDFHFFILNLREPALMAQELKSNLQPNINVLSRKTSTV